MRLSRLIGIVAAILALLAFSNAASAQDPWQQPAADLAAQIAAILDHDSGLGHGSARLMIRNLSSLPVDDIPAIRKLLEQDLRAHGVVASGAANDTIVRVTLSESARGRTWVAEVIHGDDTQIAIVDLPADPTAQTPPETQFILRREALITQKDPVLGAIELSGSMILLTPDKVVIETHAPAGWTESQSALMNPRLPLARDPRGLILQAPQGAGFDAWLAGSRCTGAAAQPPATGLAIDCHAGDDPWLVDAVAQPSTLNLPAGNSADLPAPQIRAFYNAARNYFTGVVSPGMGIDLPPFYSAAILPRASGPALLISTIDGKVLLAANGKLATVAGTSEWGSDFASIHSGCSAGAQIIVSGAANSAPGSPPSDSLRAFQISGSEATPASAPIAIEGTVTALQSAPDGKSILAVIRNSQDQYEVDRVTALCN